MSQEDKYPSQLDFGGVLRSAHDDKNKALRITSANTSVPSRYSRVELTYNASGSVTKAKFYLGTLAEERHILFTADVAGSLNNKYFTLYTENDEALYHVWYNVDGGGTDPAPAGSCGIEIPISSNDPDSIVKLATEKCLSLFCDDFKTQQLAPNKLKVTNARMGLATNSVDAGTGFTIVTNQEGEEKLIKSIDIAYDGYSKYVYNNQEKRFEVYPSTDIEVDIKNPSAMSIINTSIANADTEIAQLLPDETKRFRIRVRGNKGKLRLAYVAGETATNYRTITRGFVWDSDIIDIANGTNIYLLSNQDNIVVEIEVWTRV
jgi:hypothetical protein